MHGIRTFISRASSLAPAALGLIAAAPHLAAQTYLPLQVGNSWVYRVVEGRLKDTKTIEVESQEVIGGQAYFRVIFFGRTSLLRTGDGGSIIAYDPQTKQEQLWLPVNERERAVTALDPCSTQAQVENRTAKLKTTLGEFNNLLHIAYQPGCPDAGVTQQYFLPYVGLLRHEITTIAGPQVYELMYSRSGYTVVDSPNQQFSLSLDSSKYQGGEQVELFARITLRNTQAEPIELTFPSGQIFDFKIHNDKGETVYTWSADKLFPQVVVTERIGPGEKNWALTAPVGTLSPGRYVAEAYLVSQPKVYSAKMGFEVVR
jgi:hypothetical protein